MIPLGHSLDLHALRPVLPCCVENKRTYLTLVVDL
jgi:hypothetical protein